MNFKFKDKKFLMLEFIFLASIIANLLLDKNLYLKILLIVLYILFFILYLPNYVYNKFKFYFVNIFLIITSVLFLILKYVTSLTYVVVLVCYLVLFWYLSKIIFRTTYGVVISSKSGILTIKILDIFYTINKQISIKSKKHVNKDDIVILNLNGFFLSKKPLSIKKIIKSELK